MNGYTNGNGVPLGMVMLEEPVDEDFNLEEDNNDGIYNVAMSRNISWEYKSITLTRIPGYGFGIAVSGGSDNPHFANGDPAIAISDVLKGGPAEGKLNINDRIITANGIKLENVDYGTAVQVLRDSGPTVALIIKRRIINHNQKITLNKLTTTKLKNIQPLDYGVNLVVKVFVKDSRNGSLTEGDEIVSICGLDVAKLFDFRKAVTTTGGLEKITMGVVKQQQQTNHQPQQSYDSTSGNLYVQPPTRREQAQRESTPQRPPLPVQEQIATTPRYINFIKQASPIGIKLSGGNTTGIYISAIQPNTPASLAGLKTGDLILRVNDMDFGKLTREKAIDYLSSIKEGLVSFIVRHVENFREVLRDGRNDLLYLRVNFDWENVPKGSVVKIWDTSSIGGNYEGVLVDSGRGVSLPNSKAAAEFSKRNDPFSIVTKVNANWMRPVLFYSNFTDLIMERLLKRNYSLVENLKDIRNMNKHGILNMKPNTVETIADYGPVCLVVKTEDKSILKKSRVYSQGSYSSLLRSFNKTTTTKRIQEELQKTEQDLGGYLAKSLVVEGDNWFEYIERTLEEEYKKSVWVVEASREMDIPNYNLPPPYGVLQGKETKHYLREKRDSNQIPLPPLPIPNTLQNNTSSNQNVHRHLAHTPTEEIELPPQVDRTKKPSGVIGRVKPVPPPKPRFIAPVALPPQQQRDEEQGTYLNLPLGSQVFKSAFEVYRRPIIQPNTTSGTFTWEGGTLTQRNMPKGQKTPVQVIIPPNAIPPGKPQTIWFHVVEQNEEDLKNGNALLSPLIKFGPEHYRFQCPIEIRIPQTTTSTNASVLMSMENQSKSWSKIKINKDWVEEGEEKIVSLTVQQF